MQAFNLVSYIGAGLVFGLVILPLLELSPLKPSIVIHFLAQKSEDLWAFVGSAYAHLGFIIDFVLTRLDRYHIALCQVWQPILRLLRSPLQAVTAFYRVVATYSSWMTFPLYWIFVTGSVALLVHAFILWQNWNVSWVQATAAVIGSRILLSVVSWAWYNDTSVTKPVVLRESKRVTRSRVRQEECLQ